MKAQEVADLLRVSRATVLDWAKRGKLPCIVIRSGPERSIRRWDPDVVKRFLEECAVGSSH